jgi:ribonuclease G
VEKELVISSTSTEVEIALIENAHLVEIHSQKVNNNFSVGDIFLGSVKKLMPGLNAALDAFVYQHVLRTPSALALTGSLISGQYLTHSKFSQSIRFVPQTVQCDFSIERIFFHLYSYSYSKANGNGLFLCRSARKHP